MGFQIVVCVKHTPSATSVPVDPVTGKLRIEGLPYALNPFDEYAVEEALRLKERLAGSAVTVLSAGPARAEEAVRSALALGCDGGVLVSDPSFDGTDSLGSAYLLSLAVRRLAAATPVRLVLCGKQTNDNGSGSVGPALGAWLEWPSVSFVKKISAIDADAATVERLLEDGVDTLGLDLPAVVSVVKEINEPRLPSLKGKMASKKAVVPRWGAAELQSEAALVSSGGRVAAIKSTPPPPRGGGMTIAGGTPEEKAAHLVSRLRELKLI